MQTWVRLALAALLAAIAADAVASGAAAAGSPPIDPDQPLTKWKRMAGRVDIGQIYPPGAAAREVGGTADIRCRFTARGRLTDCKILGEQPEGYGFGPAAVKLGEFFIAEPMPGEQRPLEGASVNIPIRFTLAGIAAPTLNFNIGENAVLAVAVAGSRPRRGAFDCPTAEDPHRYCQAHRVHWLELTDPVTANTILAKARLDQGVAILECGSGSDGALTGCRLVGDASLQAEAAAMELSHRFKVAPQTEDGVSTATGSILFEIDWSRVKRVLAADAAPAR